MVPDPLCPDSPGLRRACPWGEHVSLLLPLLLELEWVHEKHNNVVYHTHIVSFSTSAPYVRDTEKQCLGAPTSFGQQQVQGQFLVREANRQVCSVYICLSLISTSSAFECP